MTPAAIRREIAQALAERRYAIVNDGPESLARWQADAKLAALRRRLEERTER